MIDAACVIVTAPYPPESTTITSPSASVNGSAAAKLRHGRARVQGFASLPLAAETKVRCAAERLAAQNKVRIRSRLIALKRSR